MPSRPLALIAFASALLFVFGIARLAQAGGPGEPAERVLQTPANNPAAQAVCIKPAESFNGRTIAQWRAGGPEGLAELMEQMRPTIEQYLAAKASPLSAMPEQQATLTDTEGRLRLIDAVAQQRDAYTAGLYWYTDLDEAKARAEETGQPILSLRMLGRLNEEYSCANSRFFRTVLYADQSVGELLREKFVLHWQSVRPVPVITIDMGDGRTIKRTITGNSAHYVLDANGRVIDCLPGLYASGTFERRLRDWQGRAALLTKLDDEAFVEAVRARHQQRAGELDRAWGRYMQVLHADQAEPVLGALAEPAGRPDQDARLPDASEAGRVAIAGKFAIERPLVMAVLPPGVPTAEQASDDRALWRRIAESYAKDARLDEMSRALMAIKAPQEPIEDAMRRAMSKRRVESPLVKMVRNFEGGVAVETARNEHLLRRQLHDWFASAQAPLDLDALNRRVYAELFLTPEEDPWLGLVPADTYSALDGGGLFGAAGEAAR